MKNKMRVIITHDIDEHHSPEHAAEQWNKLLAKCEFPIRVAFSVGEMRPVWRPVPRKEKLEPFPTVRVVKD